MVSNIITKNNILEDDQLINLIKNKFKENDMKIFELNYNIYKTFKDKKNDFIIDFDEIYEFIGFTQKGNAKRLLLKEFQANKDYIISLFQQEKQIGGHNKEYILLNINCFKRYCLLASTQQSKKIYDYYIIMEEIIMEYIESKIDEKNKLLIEKDTIIKQKDIQLQNITNIKFKAINKNKYIYIFSTDIENIYKVGRTKNTYIRKKNLQTANVNDIQELYSYNTYDDILLESIIHNILDKYRVNHNREHFNCNLDYIKLIIKISGNVLDILKSTFQNISEKEVLDHIYNNLYMNNNDDLSSNIITINNNPSTIINYNPKPTYSKDSRSKRICNICKTLLFTNNAGLAKHMETKKCSNNKTSIVIR
jgi:hypothetical protein